MKKQALLIQQTDKKLLPFKGLIQTSPAKGWVNLLRSALNMSLEQLGKKLGMSRQGVKRIEEGEISGGITINTMRKVAEAMDMKFVYSLVPVDGSIEKMIERKAREAATDIVMRTSNNMKLEGQENSQERIEKAIEEMTEVLKREIPKHLWD